MRNKEHDGLGMLGKSYRVPIYPLRPGDFTAPDSWFKVFTQQPVRSMVITPPRCSTVYSHTIDLSGKAWSGAGDVVRVDVSSDNGATWLETSLAPAPNTYAWQEWKISITLPTIGFWTVYVRATDHTGAVQPMLVPSWNPGGYGNNQASKLDIEVASPSQRGAVRSSQTEKQAPCWL